MKTYHLLFLALIIPRFCAAQDSVMTTGLVNPLDCELNRYITPGAVSISDMTRKPTKAADLSKFVPFIGNQGRQSACTAFAFAEALSIVVNQKNDKVFAPGHADESAYFYSPQYLFSVGKSRYPYPHNCSSGISYIDAFLVVRDYGVPIFIPTEYDPRSNMGCTIYPSPARIKKGRSGPKIITFQRPDKDLDLFKRLLSDTPGHPICISVYVDGNYTRATSHQNECRWTTIGSAWPTTDNRHAMVIVGYDDAISCFKVLDSRGPTSGDHGYIWMSYNLLGTAIYDCYVLSCDNSLMQELKADGNADSLMVGIPLPAWENQGLYRIFNNLRVGCYHIDRTSRTAVFRITDNTTGDVLSDDIVIEVGKQALITAGNQQLTLFLKGLKNKGGLFKKAAFFDITMAGDAVKEEFFSKGYTMATFLSLMAVAYPGDDNIFTVNSEYIGFHRKFKPGDLIGRSGLVYDGGNDEIATAVTPPLSKTRKTIPTAELEKARVPFSLANFLKAATVASDSNLVKLLSHLPDGKVTSCTLETDSLQISAYLAKARTAAPDAYERYIAAIDRDYSLIYRVTNLTALEGVTTVGDSPEAVAYFRSHGKVTVHIGEAGLFDGALDLEIYMDRNSNLVHFQMNGRVPLFVNSHENNPIKYIDKQSGSIRYN